MVTEEQIMSSEEREQVEFMWNLIPEQDRKGITQSDILYVLDVMDDYLEEHGWLDVDDVSGEVPYLDGDIDETEQLEYIREAVKADNRHLTDVQIQLIMDAEMQYGLEKGYYEED